MSEVDRQQPAPTSNLRSLIDRARTIIEIQEAAFPTAKGAAWLLQATQLPPETGAQPPSEWRKPKRGMFAHGSSNAVDFRDYLAAVDEIERLTKQRDEACNKLSAVHEGAGFPPETAAEPAIPSGTVTKMTPLPDGIAKPGQPFCTTGAPAYGIECLDWLCPVHGNAQKTNSDPLDPTNNYFRKCQRGHVAYSVSFDECPSCKIERERSAPSENG